MRFNSNASIREVAGETAIFLQGSKAGDLTKVIGLNDASLFLWENLANLEFDFTDVKNLLMERYDVSVDVAETDAKLWIETLKKHSIII